MPVVLRKKILADGRQSFFLDIHHNGARTKEYLQIYLVPRPKSPADKQLNKYNLLLADDLRAKRELSLNSDDYNFVPAFKRNASFTDYFEAYGKSYTKKDRRKSIGAFKKFHEFTNGKHVTFKQITENFAVEFKTFLLADLKLHGQTPNVYFTQFKKVIKKAYREKIIHNNPVTEVTIPITSAIRKDILTMDEIGRLHNAYCGNDHVKRGFLFSCLTGLRSCDIQQLTWSNIKETSEGLKIQMKQSKTGKDVNVNLNQDAILLLGKRAHQTEKIFVFPSNVAVGKLLKNWALKAEINKHVTYHVARHSFATNLVYYGANVKEASELMGHSSLNYTSLYLHISDSMKQKAVNNIPRIKST